MRNIRMLDVVLCNHTIDRNLSDHLGRRVSDAAVGKLANGTPFWPNCRRAHPDS